jgi:hypothetical protein
MPRREQSFVSVGWPFKRLRGVGAKENKDSSKDNLIDHHFGTHFTSALCLVRSRFTICEQIRLLDAIYLREKSMINCGILIDCEYLMIWFELHTV